MSAQGNNKMVENALASDEELGMLRESVRGYLERYWPADRALEDAKDADAIRSIWQKLAAQGLASLGSNPQEAGLREILIVMEELGRAACPAPLLGSVLANIALRDRAGDSPEAKQLLALLHDGDAAVAVSLGSYDGDPNAGTVRSTDGTLSGKLSFVEGLEIATHLLVVSEGPELAIVECGAAGLAVTFTPGLSQPPLAQTSFSKTPAVFLETGAAELEDLNRLARLALVARSLGAADRAFGMVVEYAKERHQFGQPIGKFQAIQHKLANCLTSLEGVRLTTSNTAATYDRSLDEWRFFAAAACAFAGSALRQVSLETHHTFGAIGYCEEHEAPRHFRRIHGDLTRFGGLRRARDELAHYLFDSGKSLPDYDLGPLGNAFREEVREWLASNWTAEDKAKYRALPYEWRGFDVEFSKRLGRKGWIGLSWPKEFGGKGLSPTEWFAFLEETLVAHTPMYAHEIGEQLCAPAIMKFGTDEQKKQFLPRLLAGEMSMSLGYSEPGAGSDLASLTTSAVRDEDEWVINGQKIWSTLADKAEYVWLLARTDPDAKPKQAGISIFTFPLNTPGVTVRPTMNMYGYTFNNVFYEDVRVPDSAMIGAVNGGWQVITSSLAEERLQMASWTIDLRRQFEEAVGLIRSSPAKSDPVVRDRVATLVAEIETARRFVMNLVSLAEQKKIPLVEAAISKHFSGELSERFGEAMLDLFGTGATLSEGAADAIRDGEMERQLRRSLMGVIGGGTGEIQRNLIAIRGLQLPR